MNVILTNSGATALQINSISAAGNFSETDTCQTASGIAAGATCQITVQFTPSAAGLQTGELSIAGNIATPVLVPLSGNGAGSSTGSAASFLGTDTETSGNWQAVYGADGYQI